MPYFLSKLVPPRKTFIADMSDDERAVMLAHREYWRPHVDLGLVIAMGPVADPAQHYGVSIVEIASLAALADLQARDPAILSRRGFSYENFVMPAVAARPAQSLFPVSSVTP